jgi:hypothetical protein
VLKYSKLKLKSDEFRILHKKMVSEDYISNFYLKYCIHSFQKERCVAKTISAVMTFWTLAKPGSPQALVEVSNKIPRGVESQMNSNFRTNIMKIAV